MILRKLVFIAEIGVTMNVGDFIITNQNKVLDVKDKHKQGNNVFLSRHFHKAEGFNTLANCNADYSSYYF